ncbi:hypothetical protein K8T06_11045 [bacterium]|nr:hypothetical protein [bacterium]
MKRIFPKLSLIVFTLFSLVPFCRAVTRHVPDDYATIQLAIDASAHGDVVELSEGIYVESIDFMSKAITVRAADGQLCEISNHGCCQINITNVEDGFAVLEGINLFKNDFNSENQGTLNIADSSVRVTNCDFKENITSGVFRTGGFIWITNSDVTINDCEISDTTIRDETLSSGVLFKIRRSNVRLFNTIISRNFTDMIIDTKDSELTVDSCSISNNTSRFGGGALHMENAILTITRSEISGNISQKACGGIHLVDMIDIVIGGFPNMGNTFAGNVGTYCDCILLDDNSGKTVNAQYNSFDRLLNDGIVRPYRRFDTHGCSFSETGISQDVYVSPEGSDDNDGLSSTTPFRTIQRAMRDLTPPPDKTITMHLAEGTYSSQTNGEQFPINMFSGVCVRGNTLANTVLQADGNSPVIGYVAVSDCSLSNITATGGSSEKGGGLYVADHATPNIVNCNFTSNTAERGGGAYVDNSGPIFIDCDVSSNQADYGGGIYATEGYMTVLNSQFINNSVTNYGGGLYLRAGSNQLQQCTISGNSATRGGGVRTYLPDTNYIVSCVISENQASAYGGGIACMAATTTLMNCLIISNSAVDEGGGIDARSDEEEEIDALPKILSTTITQNTAEAGDGILFRDETYGRVRNSIVYGNGDENISVSNSGSAITYSNIQGGYPGVGNIDADPLFVSGSGYDYRLAHLATGDSADSPCINAGATWARDVEFRIFGNKLTMKQFSTRSDNGVDTDNVDMGFHGQMPDFQLHPAVEILMDEYFSPGSPFDIKARVYNPSEILVKTPVTFAIQIAGQFYFWPNWSNSLCYLMLSIPHGISNVAVIPKCSWPDTGIDRENAIWIYGAMLTPDLSDIFGEMDSLEWGYGPPL